jgi:hypothetical protein
MEIFKLKNKKHKFSPSYGLYRIYILGGLSIENLNSLKATLTKANTGEIISLKEIDWKPSEYINGEKAIACYDFQINEADDYEIEFNNIENLRVKKSKLFIKNLLFPSTISLEDIKIVIK